MESSRGNKAANQFIIETEEFIDQQKTVVRYFQSYGSVICKQYYSTKIGRRITELDSYYWDYSKTTGRYRDSFLFETKAETQKKIDSGEYILTNLN